LGMKHDIGSFPVVDDHGDLVGIVTETQISQSMLQLFGTKAKKEVIDLENVDLQPGTIGKIVSIVEKLGVTIISIFSVPKRTTDLVRVYIRIKPDNKAKVTAELKKAGYEIEE
jgi:hypothetical protein